MFKNKINIFLLVITNLIFYVLYPSHSDTHHDTHHDTHRYSDRYVLSESTASAHVPFSFEAAVAHPTVTDLITEDMPIHIREILKILVFRPFYLDEPENYDAKVIEKLQDLIEHVTEAEAERYASVVWIALSRPVHARIFDENFPSFLATAQMPYLANIVPDMLMGSFLALDRARLACAFKMILSPWFSEFKFLSTKVVTGVELGDLDGIVLYEKFLENEKKFVLKQKIERSLHALLKSRRYWRQFCRGEVALNYVLECVKEDSDRTLDQSLRQLKHELRVGLVRRELLSLLILVHDFVPRLFAEIDTENLCFSRFYPVLPPVVLDLALSDMTKPSVAKSSHKDTLGAVAKTFDADSVTSVTVDPACDRALEPDAVGISSGTSDCALVYQCRDGCFLM